MLRHRTFLILTLALVVVSACAENDPETSEGQLVTSAMFQVDGDLFEAQISVNDDIISAVDLDALSSSITVHKTDDAFQFNNPSWLNVELFAMTAGVDVDDVQWHLNAEQEDALNTETTIDLVTNDTTGAGFSWQTPDLGGDTPSTPGSFTTTTVKINPQDNSLDEGSDFTAFDFDQDDYLIETYRPPKKRHRKRH